MKREDVPADWISDKDRKAFEELTRRGAVHRLSETLPDMQEVNRMKRDITHKLSGALQAGFVIRKVIEHFEGDK